MSEHESTQIPGLTELGSRGSQLLSRRAELRSIAERFPILAPFARLLEYRDETLALVEVSTGAIAGLPAIYRMVSKIEAAEASVVKASGDHAALAEREMAEGFPLLHAHAVVGLWGAFEGFHEELLIEWVRARPEAVRTSRVMELKVPIGEYEALSDAERAVFLIQALRQELSLERTVGLGQFLPLLQEVGIHGALDDGTRRDIVEFQQVRHVWAHRGGRADERFVRACPWRQQPVGARVVVSHADLHKYAEVVASYIGAVMDWMMPGFEELLA